MLLDFLKFIKLDNKINSKKSVINQQNNEGTEIIDSEQIYIKEEKEIIKSNNEKVRQIIEIVPLGDGKALKRVQAQNMDRI